MTPEAKLVKMLCLVIFQIGFIFAKTSRDKFNECQIEKTKTHIENSISSEKTKCLQSTSTIIAFFGLMSFGGYLIATLLTFNLISIWIDIGALGIILFTYIHFDKIYPMIL